jgi:hypothetical protein
MGYVQPLFNFRAKAVELRFYYPRFGGVLVIEGIEDQHFPHRVFPQGQKPIPGRLNTIKMPFQKQPPLAVLLKGIGVRQYRANVSSRSSRPRRALKSSRGIRVWKARPLSIGQAYRPD